MIKKCKFIILITIILISSLCTSCGQISENYLLYQDFPLELDAVMTFGGIKYDIYMSVTGIGTGAVIYKTPLTLAGYRYDVANDEVTVSYENLTMKMSEGSSHPAEAAIDMFTLLPEEMVSAELIDHNGIKLNCIKYECSNNNGTIIVWSTQDNIPVRIESDILALDIINFEGNTNEQNE